MLQQYEHVPKVFQKAEDGPNPISVTLESADVKSDGPCRFHFEAVRPNVFRTTFTTAKHPVPPHPSARRPEPDFGKGQWKTNAEATSQAFSFPDTDVKAVVEWDVGPPTISLHLGDAKSPIHQDLKFRSYAVDGTGVSHYSVYNKDSLHVGLGEKAAPMDLSGRGFQITASDTFGYDAHRTDPLYKHIPLLIKMTPSGCVGIFSTSHSRASWEVGSEIDGLWGRYKVYRQTHGGLEEYLIVGKTVADVVQSYASLVSFPLPVPRYMMGYVGGGMRYSMLDEPRGCDAVVDFLKKCRDHGMPCSAFQMSSGYTVAETEPRTRNVFTWNHHRFPDPRGFTQESHRLGVRLLANVKPYVLANHPAYQDLDKAGAFFVDPATGKTAVARLWSAGGGESGEGSHLDFTSKAGYEWWYNGVKNLKKVGIDVMWNDNNEYNTPDDNWQCALETVSVPDGITRKDIGLWGRALNTELNGKSSHDATVEAEPNERPFILTRSATAGTLRYCAGSWSGDNVTSWDDMKGANSLALNAGFSLLQYYGHDIGGFEGPQPTPEHLVRWVQLGVHSPRLAINCYKTSPDDNLVGDVIEPWQYPSVTPIIRDAIRRRYELMPYTYAQMLRSHREATPPQRWTGWGYESDPEVWSPKLLKSDTQYWLGDALLIAGVYEPGVETARVYLPTRGGSTDKDPGFLNINAPYQHLDSGKWHDISSPWYTSVPVLARVGSAIPIGKSVPTTCLADEDPEFPSMERDDWRGVEIFPPPLSDSPGSRAREADPETRWFENSWLEDDGISPAPKADACKIDFAYAATVTNITVRVKLTKEGGFEPLWAKNDLSIVLPVGEDRPIVLENQKGAAVTDAGRDEKGRQVWKIGITMDSA